MKQPRTYTAPHDVYTGGVLYRPGHPFTTSEPEGAEWKRVAPGKVPATGGEDADPAAPPSLD